MATYIELYDLRSNSSLLNKIVVASTKKAQTLIDLAAPTASQLAWAKKVIDNPLGVSSALFNYVLAANSSATTAAIQSASDATIQANIDAVVDKFIMGGLI
jgi:hypothetical protein